MPAIGSTRHLKLQHKRVWNKKGLEGLEDSWNGHVPASIRWGRSVDMKGWLDFEVVEVLGRRM
ncbi:hypothetical protein PoMZ_06854 [Pyricularia oryzae]|uniref:Uncharacterized protein n=1 Tax=Pyricularia oryzae TaxID=318829 RepID=A0A4P7NS68_PYROR|nr:hypothetical protein PoMZ_06854 [Pyricularia oryzae]